MIDGMARPGRQDARGPGEKAGLPRGLRLHTVEHDPLVGLDTNIMIIPLVSWIEFRDRIAMIHINK